MAGKGKVAVSALEAVRRAMAEAQPKLIRASEALAPHEGKILKPLQYDRMRVNLDTNDLGGGEYSGLSLYNPPHAESGAVAAVSNKTALSRLVNQYKDLKPGSVIHTPMVGSDIQHRGNPTMFARFHNELMDKFKKGEVDQEQIDVINNKLNSTLVGPANNKKPLFAEPIDIASPEFRLKPLTFLQRSEFADVVGGKGIIKDLGKEKGKIININERLGESIDPYVADAPTGAFGHRIVELGTNTLYDPALHGDYPYHIIGKDFGVRFKPIEKEYMTDFAKQIMEDPKKARLPSDMDFRTGDVSQRITDEWLQMLKDSGNKDGGSIHTKGYGKGGVAKEITEEFAEIISKSKKPAVNRVDMNYKDVTKRVPQLTEAANRLAKGEITAADYNYLVDLYKPVKSYDFVPEPATTEDAMRALSKNKQPMFGKLGDITPGEQTDLRLDIPAYRDHGVWVNSIHRKDAPTVYGSVSSVKNATMVGAPDKALKVATGETSKSPFAVIRGEWNPTDEKAAVEGAQKYLNDKDWVQVGYDPERHGYFYNRQTMEPIESAEEVIQIGPLVLAKKPKYAVKEEQKFVKGGTVQDDTQYIQDDPTAYLMNEVRPIEDTKIRDAIKFAKTFGSGNMLGRLTGSLVGGIKNTADETAQEVKRLKPQSAIDIPVNAAAEAVGFPMDIASDLVERAAPIRSDVVAPRSQYATSNKPLPFTSQALKQRAKEAGITSGEEFPNLQLGAQFISPSLVKPIGAAVKGYGNLVKEGIERNIGMIEPRMGIIKDPGGMLVGGEKALDNELIDMKRREQVYDQDQYRTTAERALNRPQSQPDPNAIAFNKWVDTKVRKYLRNQAGTEADPILKAIESGVEHNFQPTMGDTKYSVRNKRLQVGKPEAGIAKTELGKEFEYKIDSMFDPKSSEEVKAILNDPLPFADPNTAERFRASKLRTELDLPIQNEKDVEALRLLNEIPDKNVYTLSGTNITDRLGLNHVGDVLMEDLAAGRLTPQQLDQMSIEKAIRRTAEYDAQKAKEMAKAHATSVEGMPIPKEYDDGFKWVELKHETDPKKTASALKSEGEMMGHCVGSYCPQVESGGTQIFSLRSPDGKSHVTIEANKRNHLNDWLEANKEEIEKDPLLKQMSYYDADEKYPGMYSEEEVQQAYIADITKMLKAKGAPVYEAPNSWIDIVQVKGKQNKRPDDKYQKYITDFVKSKVAKHEITDIRELQNTNLYDVQSIIAEGVMPKKLHMHPDVDKAVGIDQPHLAARMNDARFSNEITDEKFNLFKNIGKDFASKGQYYISDEDILDAIRAKYLPPKKAKGGPINLETEYKLENMRRRYG